jgi:hypothetical protein
LHQAFAGLVPPVELDNEGFWGRRQEFKEGKQSGSPARLEVEVGKYSFNGLVKFCWDRIGRMPRDRKTHYIWWVMPRNPGFFPDRPIGPGIAFMGTH